MSETANTFLSKVQLERIDEAHTLAQTWDLPQDDGAIIPVPFMDAIRGSLNSTRNMIRGKSTTGQGLHTPESATSFLSEVATQEVTQYLANSSLLRHLISMAAREEVRQGGNTERVMGPGRQLARHQANHATSVIGFGSRLLLIPAPFLDEPTTWDQARKTYEDQPKLKVPREISEEEANAHADRLKKLTEAKYAKLEHRGLRRLGSVARQAWQKKRTTGMEMSLTGLTDFVVSMSPYQDAEGIPDEERAAFERTIKKQAAFLDRASLANSDLAQNPLVKFFLFIQLNFGSLDPMRTQNEFDRDVSKTARAIRKRAK